MELAARSSERIMIIRHIHGKITRDGKRSEPDIYWILEQWLERHPEIKSRSRDIRVVQGVMSLLPGVKTDLIHATIVAGPDIAGYDPAQDQDLYLYFLAEDQGDQ